MLLSCYVCRHSWLIILGTNLPWLRHCSNMWAETKGGRREDCGHSSSELGWWSSCSSLLFSPPFQSSPQKAGWFLLQSTMTFLVPQTNHTSHRFARKAVPGRRTQLWHCGAQTHHIAEFPGKDLPNYQWVPGVHILHTAGYLERDLLNSQWVLGVQIQRSAGFQGKDLPLSLWALGDQTLAIAGFLERETLCRRAKLRCLGSLTSICRWFTSAEGLTFGASTERSFYHGKLGWAILDEPFSTQRRGDQRAQTRGRRRWWMNWGRGPWKLCCLGAWTSKVQCWGERNFTFPFQCTGIWWKIRQKFKSYESWM